MSMHGDVRTRQQLSSAHRKLWGAAPHSSRDKTDVTAVKKVKTHCNCFWPRFRSDCRFLTYTFTGRNHLL